MMSGVGVDSRSSNVTEIGLANRSDLRVAPRASTSVATTASLASESLMKLVWRGRWLMLICLVLALAAGFAYIETATPIYGCRSRLYLDYGSISVVQSYDTGRMPRTDRYLYTQAELLASRPILGAVLEAPEIREMRTFANTRSPLAYLRSHIRVSVGRKDEIINVSFDSPYPLEAAQIVNRVVDTYMASRSDHEQRNSSQVLEMFQGEMRRATQELDAKRGELKQFQTSGMPLAMSSDQGRGVTQLYLALQTELTQARRLTDDAESFFNSVEALSEDPDELDQYLRARGLGAVYAGPAGATAPLEAQLSGLETELEGLLIELTPEHPRAVALKAQIGRIEGRISQLNDDFVRVTLAAAKRTHLEAQETSAALVKQYEAQGKKVAQLSEELNEYDRLTAEVAQLTEYCRTIDQKIKETRSIVGEDVGQLRMEILETAIAAHEPSEPQKARVMTMALVLGSFSGGCLAVLRSMLDQTLRSTEEISALLGLPLLGVVPAMSRRQKVALRGQKVRLQPDSPEAEAFRTIRTTILFGAPRETARTMLVTSPAAGDGKSTLVSNLAITMAQTGQRTVLLDADFRRPTQHIIFGTDHEKCGLNAVLTGQAELEEAIRSTPTQGLSLISCGGHLPNPAEVLNSHRFSVLLRRLAKMYDRVIIDAPPVTVVTDAQILGAICDVTVLVLRADKSTKRLTQRAIDALQGVNAHLLGIVVNDVRKGGDRFGYYGSYSGSPDRKRCVESVEG